MIKRIGFKRLFIIGSLVGLIVGLAFFSYSIAEPQRKENIRDRSSADSRKTALQKELEIMREDMVVFQDRKLEYQRLIRTGFVTHAGVERLRQYLDVFKNKSGILTATYDIKAPMQEPMSDVIDEKYPFMRHSVSVTLTAFDDIDIYRFIYYINYALPGISSITGITVDRTAAVTENLLLQVEEGALPSTVRARIDFDWKVIRPASPDLPIDMMSLGVNQIVLPSADAIENPTENDTTVPSPSTDDRTPNAVVEGEAQ